MRPNLTGMAIEPSIYFIGERDSVAAMGRKTHCAVFSTKFLFQIVNRRCHFGLILSFLYDGNREEEFDRG